MATNAGNALSMLATDLEEMQARGIDRIIFEANRGNRIERFVMSSERVNVSMFASLTSLLLKYGSEVQEECEKNVD